MSATIAQDQAQQIRDSVQEKWGFVPNLVEQLLASPIGVAVSAVNGCRY